ncbi:ATP-binding protein [Belnapia mucosa]|uniref:ATP-binding protein n=1 Tax=Belnapia mucosa TaxID=2804532 RepID=UPI002E285C42|nr:ATP-binding protein [Belnapia mucosa]
MAATEAIRRRGWPGLAMALAAPLLGLALRLLLDDLLTGYPFLTFFPAILAAAFLGGWLAGALATLLSAGLSGYFLIEPVGSFHLSWPSGAIGMASFITVSTIMVALLDQLLRAATRLAETGRQMQENQARLEEQVALRTRELTLLNAHLREQISRRDRAEAQVRQMQKMEAVGQLTGGIAHDFNNMLAIIIGSLDVMRRRLGQGRTDIEKHLDHAMDGARRAAALTHKLLAFARRQPLAPVVVDANALIAELEELFRRTLGEQVKLECVLAGGLWRCMIDPGQLENALLNLVVNARDAMPQGGRLTIETQNAYLDDAYAAAEADVTAGQYVLIAVTDTGTGMPPEVIARAFDPFFTTKGEGRGTGLGLSQVHGFVKQSRGHIKIYSEQGHGTTLKLYLPRHTGEGGPAAGEPPAAAIAPAGSGLILLVEDDEAVRRVHSGMLRELGYTVEEAPDGVSALSMLPRLGPVQLLFTDVVMPGMSGRMLAEQARQQRPGLRVLYTTGYTPNAIVHNGVVDAGVELLTKPFSFDQLARKVRQVLDKGG